MKFLLTPLCCVFAFTSLCNGQVADPKGARDLLESGRLEEAKASFRQILENGITGDGAVAARLGMAEAMLGLGEIFEAEEAISAVLAEHPDDSSAIWLLARTYCEHANALRADAMSSAMYIRSRYADAERLCTTLLQEAPSRVDVLSLRGDCRFWQENIEGALADYLTALQGAPDDVNLLFTVGDVYGQYLGRYSEAIPYLRKSLELDPSFAPANRGLAQALVGVGNTSEAIETYVRCLKIDPNDSEIFAQLWDLYAGKEPPRYEDALSLYDRIDKECGGYLASWNKASVYRLAGREAEALTTIEEMLKEYPDWDDARLLEARCNVSLGRNDDAVAGWIQVLDHTPDNEEAFLGLMEFAQQQAEAGNGDRSLEVYDALIQRRPEDAVLRSDRALTLYNMGKVEEAMQAYQDAVRLAPYDSQLLNDVGLAYQGIRDIEKAIEYFKRSSEVDGNLDAHENYAVVLFKLGDYGKSNQLFERILERDPFRQRSLKYYLDSRRMIMRNTRLRK